MKKICITGANGFIGKSICETLINSKQSIRALVRTINYSLNSPEIEYIQIKDIISDKKLKEYLTDCSCVIHCAGMTNAINDKNNLSLYRLSNVETTKYLAEQAVKANVKRFVFLSSVKVNGEITNKPGYPKIFSNNSIPNPHDNYAISKLEAEKVLWKISLNTKLEVVVVRLPLVYGFGAKGNLQRLIKLISYGIPLPFKGIYNKRAYIGIDNAVDLLIRCTEHPNAAGQTFLVSDGQDLSTPDLIYLIASAMDLKVNLFLMPKVLLKFFGFILKKKKEIDRLIESLQIENSYVCKTLNWKPPVSIKDGIKKLVKSK